VNARALPRLESHQSVLEDAEGCKQQEQSVSLFDSVFLSCSFSLVHTALTPLVH